jgi:hypothetical protein
MATVTFDTMEFMETLTAAGMPEQHAKAITKATAVAIASALGKAPIDVIKKDDIQKINDKFNALSSDLRMTHITLGLLVVAVLIPTIKSLV